MNLVFSVSKGGFTLKRGHNLLSKIYQSSKNISVLKKNLNPSKCWSVSKLLVSGREVDNL